MLCGVLARQHKLLLVIQHVGGVAKCILADVPFPLCIHLVDIDITCVIKYPRCIYLLQAIKHLWRIWPGNKAMILLLKLSTVSFTSHLMTLINSHMPATKVHAH